MMFTRLPSKLTYRWILTIGLLIFLPALLTHAEPVITIQVERVPQGGFTPIRIEGENITRVRAAFLDHQYLLLPDTDGSFTGVIAAPLESEPGAYRLSLLVQYIDGSESYIPYEMQVIFGSFAEADLALPATLTELLDPEILLDEFSILDSQLNTLTPDSAWLKSGLRTPVNMPQTAGFGTFRQFNGAVWQRHTGVDFRATIGTPIQAAASGRVIYHGILPIRGEYVLLDHGSGLMTGYAHLSSSEVEVGDWVIQGEVIGRSGSTGRSTGAHLHWEAAISGVWVDPLQLQAWLADRQTAEN